MDQQAIVDELARLASRNAKLESEVTSLREKPARWRRVTALGAVLGAVAVGLVASAGAAPTTDTTAVAFVSVPAKKVMSANSIAPGATESVIVIGGTTTVPSNATTVRLDVTVKGTAAGTITLFPTGNEAGGAGHTVSWVAGATVTETEAENVGMSNKVSVKNSSTKAAVVTLTITGYSTQVTAGDINGSGGSNGEVLTNNGSGGVEWRTPQPAYATSRSVGIPIPFDGANVAQLSLPAGSYLVSATGTVFSNHSTALSSIYCFLVSASTDAWVGQPGYVTSTNWNDYQALSVQGLFTTGGDSVKLRCHRYGGTNGWLFNPTITAVRVGSVTGDVTTARETTADTSESVPPRRQR